MNYYERHIGDYIKDTVSLSMLEDGAYNRLMDQHYQTETPLPPDRKEVYRLARANSAIERKAVDYVLDKFWDSTPEGFTQKRVQAEIERFQEKKRKAKASADARWGNRATPFDPDANASDSHDAQDMRTHSERNAHQSPVTSHQSPSLNTGNVVVLADRLAPGQEPPPDGEAENDGIPPCDHKAVLKLWATLLPAHPQPARWTDTRQAHLRARWRELFAEGKAKTPEDALRYFSKFFRYIGQSKFLTGRAKAIGDRPPFVAELDWVLRPENYTKCIEGKYHTED